MRATFGAYRALLTSKDDAKRDAAMDAHLKRHMYTDGSPGMRKLRPKTSDYVQAQFAKDVDRHTDLLLADSNHEHFNATRTLLGHYVSHAPVPGQHDVHESKRGLAALASMMRGHHAGAEFFRSRGRANGLAEFPFAPGDIERVKKACKTIILIGNSTAADAPSPDAVLLARNWYMRHDLEAYNGFPENSTGFVLSEPRTRDPNADRYKHWH